MDPWEVELARLKENNKSMYEFIVSSGLEGAYTNYRESIGLPQEAIMCFEQYVTSKRLTRNETALAERAALISTKATKVK